MTPEKHKKLNKLKDEIEHYKKQLLLLNVQKKQSHRLYLYDANRSIDIPEQYHHAILQTVKGYLQVELTNAEKAYEAL